MPCRINRREEWTTRLLLEFEQWDHAAFITLTYSDQNLPKLGSLSKRDTQLWLKRLRKLLAPRKIRYFMCGEYGPRTERPHYHAVVFGLDPITELALIEKSWALGFVTASPLTPGRARYCARYVTKKLTSPKSFSDGRTPEFGTMSRRPGLGADTAMQIARSIPTDGEEAVVQVNLKFGKVHLRFDRYIREKLLSGRSAEYWREIRSHIYASKTKPYTEEERTALTKRYQAQQKEYSQRRERL